jgi:uncharacterized delta-60 repeat protein
MSVTDYLVLDNSFGNNSFFSPLANSTINNVQYYITAFNITTNYIILVYEDRSKNTIVNYYSLDFKLNKQTTFTSTNLNVNSTIKNVKIYHIDNNGRIFIAWDENSNRVAGQTIGTDGTISTTTNNNTNGCLQYATFNNIPSGTGVTSYVKVTCITTDSNNNIYISGFISASTTNTNIRLFILKYNSSGQIQTSVGNEKLNGYSLNSVFTYNYNTYEEIPTKIKITNTNTLTIIGAVGTGAYGTGGSSNYRDLIMNIDTSYMSVISTNTISTSYTSISNMLIDIVYYNSNYYCLYTANRQSITKTSIYPEYFCKLGTQAYVLKFFNNFVQDTSFFFSIDLLSFSYINEICILNNLIYIPITSRDNKQSYIYCYDLSGNPFNSFENNTNKLTLSTSFLDNRYGTNDIYYLISTYKLITSTNDLYVGFDNIVYISSNNQNINYNIPTICKLSLQSTLIPTISNTAIAVTGLTNSAYSYANSTSTTYRLYIQSIKVLSTGKIIAGGYSINSSNNKYTALLLCYLSTGTLDTSFGRNGYSSSTLYSAINSIDIDASGNIYTAGYALDSVGKKRFAIAKYTSTGSLDTTFNTTGVYKSYVYNNGSYADEVANTCKLYNGFIYAAGQAKNTSNITCAAVVKISTNGTPDSSGIFNTSQFYIYTPSTYAVVNDLCIDSGGNIILAGAVGNAYALIFTSNSTIKNYTISDATGSNIRNAKLISGNKIVGVISSSSNFIHLVKFNSDGTLDTTFGDNATGLCKTDLIDSSSETSTSVYVHSNGLIYVSGYKYINTVFRLFIGRYTSNGQIDSNYGANFTGFYDYPFLISNVEKTIVGITMDINSTNVMAIAGYSMDTINNAALLITTTGTTFQQSSTILNTNFNSNGLLYYSQNSSTETTANAIKLLPNGSVIVAGYYKPTSTTFASFIAKFTNTGVLDTSFGEYVTGTTGPKKGYVLNVGTGTNNNAFNAIYLQSDGKIVVTGYAIQSTTGQDFIVARYSSNGDYDTSFGNFVSGTSGSKTGKLFLSTSTTTNITDIGNAVDFDYNGRIIVGGISNNNMAIIRINTDGQIDTSFATSPSNIFTYNGTTTQVDEIKAISILPDNRIVAGGYYNNADFCLICVKSDGSSLDTTFGTNGIITISPASSGTDTITGVKVDNNNNIVLCFTDTNIQNFLLRRYKQNGALDTTFGDGGSVSTDIKTNQNVSQNDTSNALSIGANGDIYVAGTTNNNFAIACYTQFGKLDTTFGTNKTGIEVIDMQGLDLSYSIDVDINGNIVMAGKTTANANNTSYAIGIVYLKDASLASYFEGSLDTRYFGDTTGIVTNNIKLFSSYINQNFGTKGTTITTNNLGAITCYDMVVSGTSIYVCGDLTYSDGIIAKYNADTGVLDTSFGDFVSGTTGPKKGYVTTNLYGSLDANFGIAVDASGNVVVVGFARDNFSDDSSTIVRYTSGGILDTTFNRTGKLTVGIITYPDKLLSVKIDGSGNIIAGGWAHVDRMADSSSNFYLVKVKNDGSNILEYFLPSGNYEDRGICIALLPNNNILIGGYVADFNYNLNYAVYCVKSDLSGLDASFNTIRYGLNNSVEKVNDIAVDATGNIFVCWSQSTNTNFLLSKYTSNGTLSNTFNIDMGGIDISTRVRLSNTGGYIYIAGISDSKYGLCCLNSDGTFNTNYGVDGKIYVDFNATKVYSVAMAIDSSQNVYLGGTINVNNQISIGLSKITSQTLSQPLSPSPIRINTVAVQSDDKIVVAGYITTATNNNDFYLARYNVDGSLDNENFGTNNTGFISLDFNGKNDVINGIAIDALGNILVAGSSTSSSSSQVLMALAKYNKNGILDSTKTYNFGSTTNNYVAYAIGIDSSGNIIMCGAENDGLTSGKLIIVRLLSDGSFDTTFGNTMGYTITDITASIADVAKSLVILPNNSIIVGGSTNNNFVVAKYTSSGILDTTFGTNGRVITNIPLGSVDMINSIKLTPAGNIIVAGYNGNDFALACYTANGVLNTGFGTTGTGITTTDIGTSSTDKAYGIAIDSTGNIYVAGSTNNSYALARYTSRGILDLKYGNAATPGTGRTGKIVQSFSPAIAEALGIAIDSFDRVILAGYVGNGIALLRYVKPSSTSAINVSTVCFPGDTPVVTDQGICKIKLLDKRLHTINGNKIKAITQNILATNKIICIMKNALGDNVPDKLTCISPNHGIYVDNELIEAKDLIEYVDGIYYVPYNGEILYNVLLDNHGKMIVNNMEVETLHPENIIAKLYNEEKFSELHRNNIIEEMNDCYKTNNIHKFVRILNNLE